MRYFALEVSLRRAWRLQIVIISVVILPTRLAVSAPEQGTAAMEDHPLASQVALHTRQPHTHGILAVVAGLERPGKEVGEADSCSWSSVEPCFLKVR